MDNKAPLKPLQLKKVRVSELDAFREVVNEYWRELMPQSPVVKDVSKGETYFEKRFTWEGESGHPYWAIADGERVGFLMYKIIKDAACAQVHDFYVIPDRRRQGFGSAMFEMLISRLDEMGIRQIDLNVRVDNPGALEFWVAQGLEIALHRLRLCRNNDEANDT